MNRDIYTTFLGAKGVAFAWIGAALGPIFLGFSSNQQEHLVFGIGALILVALSFGEGIRALKHGSMSDFLVYMIVPALLLTTSCSYVFFT
ncbi:hypothetical protein BZL42_24185 [Pseudomonas indica]|nr:hypothetical protein BZL42_24185 [Pseudomonas indica]